MHGYTERLKLSRTKIRINLWQLLFEVYLKLMVLDIRQDTRQVWQLDRCDHLGVIDTLSPGGSTGRFTKHYWCELYSQDFILLPFRRAIRLHDAGSTEKYIQWVHLDGKPALYKRPFIAYQERLWVAFKAEGKKHGNAHVAKGTRIFKRILWLKKITGKVPF